MKPEAQRVAIAEACGWRFVKGDKSDPWVMKHDDHWKSPMSLVRNNQPPADMWFGGIADLPDYLTDLNAMAEAEMTLGEYVEPYLDRLASLPPPLYDVRATAAQRAEAFLRTLNLWTP